TYREILPAPAESRAALEAIARGEVARLVERRDWLWEQFDGPNREDAAACALVDDSAEGARLLRYEAAHNLPFHRAYQDLLRRRRELRAEPRQAPNTPPATAPEKAPSTNEPTGRKTLPEKDVASDVPAQPAALGSPGVAPMLGTSPTGLETGPSGPLTTLLEAGCGSV